MKEYKLRKREKILEEKIVALQDTKKNTHSLILKIEKNLDPNSSYLKEKAINLLQKNRNFKLLLQMIPSFNLNIF